MFHVMVMRRLGGHEVAFKPHKPGRPRMDVVRDPRFARQWVSVSAQIHLDAHA